MTREKKSKTTAGTAAAADRLSDLPEEVIHRIMSFLSPSTVARFCVLSKRLSSARLSFPELNIDYTDLCHVGREDELLPLAGHALRRLLHQGLGLRKLRLNLLLHDKSDHRFAPAVSLATQVLDDALELAVRDRVPHLRLHCHAFSNGRPVRIPVAFTDTLSWRWLRSLTLDGLRLSSPELVVDSPLLEDFRISSCSGVTGIEFSGAVRLLETIVIDACSGLARICVGGPASLREFSICSNDHCRIDLDDSARESLRLLNMNCPGIVAAEWLRDEVPKLVSLETLLLKHHGGLESFSIRNLSLKHFRLSANNSLCSVHVAAPSLETFVCSYKNPESEVDICGCNRLRTLELSSQAVTRKWVETNLIPLSHLEDLTLKSLSFGPESATIFRPLDNSETPFTCSNLKNAEICFPGIRDHNERPDFSRRFLDFLYLFSHCNTLQLNIGKSLEDFYIYRPGQSRKNPYPPLYGLKNLKIVMYIRKKKTRVAELVDSFLWLAPKLETISLIDNNQIHAVSIEARSVIIKFRYTALGGSDRLTCCCSNSLMRCWRHDFVEVSINRCVGKWVTQSLHSYFMENSKAKITLVKRSNQQF